MEPHKSRTSPRHAFAVSVETTVYDAVARRHEATERFLAEHVPLDDKEARDLELMRRVVRYVPAPFSRRTFPHHFTASAVVVTPRRDRVLLVHHRRLDRWLQPGGHFEPHDPDPLAAALREAREETGLEVFAHPDVDGLLDVDVHAIPGRGDEPDHFHLDLRFLVAADPAARISAHAGETKEARWFTADGLAALGATGELGRLLTKALG